MQLKIFISLVCVFFLSACGNSDIKDNYCGIHINYQYCKCAFHGEHCGNVGMSSGEAKDYVFDKYDKWKNGDVADLLADCTKKNGSFHGNTCSLCASDEVVKDNVCVAKSDEEAEEESEDEDAEVEGDEEEVEGDCRFDSDCDPICEADVAWKMGCDARENKCVKTFDTNCSEDIEIFGGLDFEKVCSEGVCARDEVTMAEVRANLLKEKQVWSNTVKEINAVRLDMNIAMLDSNKNCLNGLADMTNLAIVEFATRVGSILAGGIPDVAAMTASAASTAGGLISESIKDLASAAVDYAGFAVQKLSTYEQGAPKDEEKKLKPHEYIKLNCDLYQYFKGVIAESDAELEMALEKAREVDALLNSLP